MRNLKKVVQLKVKSKHILVQLIELAPAHSDPSVIRKCIEQVKWQLQ